MAAPSSVYKDLKLVDDTTLQDRELYVAAYLQNSTPMTGSEWGNGYFNASDIPAGSDDRTTANDAIKGIFKLDSIYPVASGSTTTGAGFIGAISCDAAGNLLGNNAQYHSGSRYSGLIYQSGSAAWYRLLNDGGINRRSHGEMKTDHNPVYWCNYAALKTYFRSAFYNETTDYGFRYRLNGGTWVIVSFAYGVVLPRKQEKTIEERGFLIAENAQGDLLDVEAYTVNEEGTFYSTPLTEYLWEDLTVVPADLYIVPNNPSEVPTYLTIYLPTSKYNLLSTVTEESSVTGIFFYTSDLCTYAVKAPEGYYNFNVPIHNIEVGGLVKYKMYYVASNGEVTKYALRDAPLNPEITTEVSFRQVLSLEELVEEWFVEFNLRNVVSNSQTHIITGKVTMRNSLGNIKFSNLASVTGSIASGSFRGETTIPELYISSDPGDTLTFEDVVISTGVAHRNIPCNLDTLT